jgi:hypothetical protein
VQTRIASHEDTTGLHVVDKNLEAMELRLWEDIIPLTRNQWRGKRLGVPENFDLAVQYLGAAIDAFAYMNTETVHSSLKGVFNNIANEWKDFGNAINAIREPKNEPAVFITALWEEFVRLRWSIMTTRTHHWVMEHVNELRTILIEMLEQHEPPSFGTYSAEQWNITNKLHLLAEVTARADFTILLPMDGYTRYTPSESDHHGLSPDITLRTEVYANELKLATKRKQVERSIHDIFNGSLGTDRGLADPVSIVHGILDQKEAQEDLRKAFAGHVTVPLVAED